MTLIRAEVGGVPTTESARSKATENQLPTVRRAYISLIFNYILNPFF